MRVYACACMGDNFLILTLKTKKNEKKIVNWILRRGEFQNVTLAVDYRTCLANHVDFERFNALLREIRALPSEKDKELRRLTVALVNSPFWDYADGLADLTENEIVARMADRMCVEVQLHRHLTLIANHYKLRRHRYSAEKVILEQMLASLADFGMQMAYEEHYSLVPFLLLKELREWVEDISVFESEGVHEVDSSAMRIAMVERTLGYLGREHHGRRVIATDEYATLVMEVKVILTTGHVPDVIVPLMLQPNGALRSGFSVGFVMHGIYRLYCRYKVERNVWIDYLCMKISRSKSTIEKKFSLKPDTWAEKIEGD